MLDTEGMGKDAVAMGLSLPRYLVEYIDAQRGDVSRSRFILRLLEKGIRSNEGTEHLILSNILQKNTVDFLQARITLFEKGRELFGDENQSFYRTLIHIYSEALAYLKKPTTTNEALKEKMIDLRPTPQATLPFVGNGHACMAAIDDIISFLETGKPLMPQRLVEISEFFIAFNKQLEFERFKKKLEDQARMKRELEKEQEEADLKTQNERLLGVGLDPKKVKPFLAKDVQEAGHSD